jgi:hypothetical protein
MPIFTTKKNTPNLSWTTDVDMKSLIGSKTL